MYIYLRAAGCAVVEIEGAFLIGMIAAINYLGLSRLLQLIRVDDMVGETQGPRTNERNPFLSSGTGASVELVCLAWRTKSATCAHRRARVIVQTLALCAMCLRVSTVFLRLSLVRMGASSSPTFSRLRQKFRLPYHPHIQIDPRIPLHSSFGPRRAPCVSIRTRAVPVPTQNNA